ncbi:hypothetical protein DFP72DRAFT_524401 [Ephemerocybe angulata]|uniref:Uncharacterized protein n=1 Tax=Ephemerocybe angulata TaxID=980116 RepID=A0A8H6ICN6_9AGAR|nr:hypothetical protein DFP72DRAFT_524401 [Tulosesus angulatus]
MPYASWIHGSFKANHCYALSPSYESVALLYDDLRGPLTLALVSSGTHHPFSESVSCGERATRITSSTRWANPFHFSIDPCNVLWVSGGQDVGRDFHGASTHPCISPSHFNCCSPQGFCQSTVTSIKKKCRKPISLITSLEHCLLGRRRYQSLDSRVKICRISTCRCVTRSPLGLAISLQLQNRLPVVPLVRVALGLLKLLLLPPANEDKKLHHTSRLGLYDSS